MRPSRPAVALLAGLLTTVANAQAPDTKRVVTDERTGEKVVLVRWAVGRPDNVVTLRQPLGHTSLWAGAIGAALGPDAGDRTLRERQSATAMSFSALLPDLRPWSKETMDLFTRPGGGDVVSGLVATTVYEGNPRTPLDFLTIYLNIDSKYLIRVVPSQPHPMRVAERPDRFGLRRIGPVPALLKVERASVDLHDLYYAGASPEESSFYIKCNAEEVRSKEDDPREMRVPQCTHVFLVEGLSAIAEVHYRRVFLPNWREIQAGIEAKLLSFLPARE